MSVRSLVVTCLGPRETEVDHVSASEALIECSRRTWDDDDHTAGNLGPRNVCLLAKYGDGGAYRPDIPTRKSYAELAHSSIRAPHYFGNCRAGTCDDCYNSNLMHPGTQWSKVIGIGDTCKGGNEGHVDTAWARLVCYF